jgi:hypothetical protein
MESLHSSLADQVGDKYYGVGTLNDDAPASEFEFSR